MKPKKGARLKLKSFRNSLYMTQGQMSDKLGISKNHYCNIENGVSNPSAKLVENFAKTFDCDAYDLFKKDE